MALSDAIRIIGKEFGLGLKYIEKGLSNPNIDKYPFLKGQLYNIKGLLILEGKKPKPKEAIPHFENSINNYLCSVLSAHPCNRLKVEELIRIICSDKYVAIYYSDFHNLFGCISVN